MHGGFLYSIGDVLVHRVFAAEAAAVHWRTLDHAPRLYVVGRALEEYAGGVTCRVYYLRPANVYATPSTIDALVKLPESELVRLEDVIAAQPQE